MRSLVVALAALALLPAQTPAPRHIALTRVFPSPGLITLFVANADGAGEHPLLSTTDTDYDAVWAPDGASIVFTSERNGSADLFRVAPDGSGLTPLTTDPAYDDQAAFSPDSKQLVFVSTRGGGFANLWTLDLATHRTTALTTGPGGDFRPSWSPDGKWIAFASGRSKSMPFANGRWERLQLADIYLIHPDGSGLKKLPVGGDTCGSPKWMADSAHVVAYCMQPEQSLANRRPAPEPGNDTHLVSIDIATGAAADLKSGPGVKIDPSPLPANQIAYIRKDGAEPGIYYSDGRRGPTGPILIASFSPDGARVVFHRRNTTPRATLHTAFSRNANYQLSFAPSMPVFSPSGHDLLMNSAPSTKATASSISITAVDDPKPRIVYEDKTRNVLAGGWSPDGRRIIFSIGAFTAFFDGFHTLFHQPADRVDAGAQVAIVNSDGTGFTELTAEAGNNAFPSFSPDGNRFVYRTFTEKGYGLRIMNLETKAISALTHEYDNFPLWSPRGDLIMFARQIDDAYEVFTIKPDGSSLKRLTFTKGNDAHMAWSPDGEYIVFTSSRMGFKDEVVYTNAPQPYGEIFVMRFDGTGVEQLTDNQWEEGTPAWQRVAK